MTPKLAELMRKAKARWDAMTPEQKEAELRAQRESWVRGEIGMGSDADEAAYRAEMRYRKAARLRDEVRRFGT